MIAAPAASAPHRRPALRELGAAGADESRLLTKTKRLHWILEGPQAAPLLALCDEQCNVLAGFVARIEERRRVLDDSSSGMVADPIEPSALGQPRTSASSVDEAVQDLLADHDTIGRSLRGYLEAGGNDGTTTALLQSILEGHERMARALRSYIASHAAGAP